ncbi:hypothetical protein EX30DRAFT_338511 [Ascodesmis nigricans]|uniref:Endoplasmic reticulum lectin n=1 Tax=Ascodesmis nigricans TaxID=341454 RepID=A0A4S2N435_9PEZI|nr:hypothetical protein EX30DRAFT_338511 [Ascodesmis nigricans]
MYALFLILSLLAATVVSLFSVHDDVLAFPQYEILIADAYITDESAAALLNPIIPPDAPPSLPANESETHQIMWLKGKKFLCTIPIVLPPPPMNQTEKELSKVEEDKELARATARGWELLADLEGHCLYFVSDWWTYSFCHNREVRQFHQLPPQANNQWPPPEDPEIQSYILGKVPAEEYNTPNGEPGSTTELQATGELRVLVQKLGGGTVCEDTGKRRKIEVQFHCNSHGTDRIGWVKEITICNYLMVIYTPRLCNDVAFLPARENRANGITCKEVIRVDEVEQFEKLQADRREAQKLLAQQAEEALVEVIEELKAKKKVVIGKDGKIREDATEKLADDDSDELVLLLDL